MQAVHKKTGFVIMYYKILIWWDENWKLHCFGELYYPNKLRKESHMMSIVRIRLSAAVARSYGIVIFANQAINSTRNLINFATFSRLFSKW